MNRRPEDRCACYTVRRRRFGCWQCQQGPLSEQWDGISSRLVQALGQDQGIIIFGLKKLSLILDWKPYLIMHVLIYAE